MAWSRFHGHPVKPLVPVFQSRPRSNSSNTNDVECCCDESLFTPQNSTRHRTCLIDPQVNSLRLHLPEESLNNPVTSTVAFSAHDRQKSVGFQKVRAFMTRISIKQKFPYPPVLLKASDQSELAHPSQVGFRQRHRLPLLYILFSKGQISAPAACDVVHQ